MRLGKTWGGLFILTAASELQTQGMRLGKCRAKEGPQARKRTHEQHRSTQAQAKPREDGRARRARITKTSVSEAQT